MPVPTNTQRNQEYYYNGYTSSSSSSRSSTSSDCSSSSHRTTTTTNGIQRCNSRFFTISSLRCELSPTCTLKWPRCSCVQIMCSTSSAYHVQHVVLCAMWYEGTAQLLSLTELKLHYLSFILLAKPLNR